MSCKQSLIALLIAMSSPIASLADEAPVVPEIGASKEINLGPETKNQGDFVLRQALIFAVRQAQPFGAEDFRVREIEPRVTLNLVRIHHGEKMYDVGLQKGHCAHIPQIVRETAQDSYRSFRTGNLEETLGIWKDSTVKLVKDTACLYHSTISCDAYTQSFGTNHLVVKLENCVIPGIVNKGQEAQSIVIETVPVSDRRVELVRVK